MNDGADDICKQIFRQRVGDHVESVSMDPVLLQVFLECDGRRTIAEIAGKIGREPESLQDPVHRLVELGLIHAARVGLSWVDRDFFQTLNLALSKSIGPIAPVLVDEEVEAMGHRRDRFPVDLAADLVDTLAREIQPRNKRNEFQVEMVRLIRDKGYVR